MKFVLLMSVLVLWGCADLTAPNEIEEGRPCPLRQANIKVTRADGTITWRPVSYSYCTDTVWTNIRLPQ